MKLRFPEVKLPIFICVTRPLIGLVFLSTSFSPNAFAGTTDLYKEGLLGPIYTVRTEVAEVTQRERGWRELPRRLEGSVVYNSHGNRIAELPGQPHGQGAAKIDSVRPSLPRVFYIYDAAGKLNERMDVSVGDPRLPDYTLLQRHTYSYDAQGRLREEKIEGPPSSRSDTLSGVPNHTITYSYDEKGRLTTTEGEVGRTTYTYDDKGNLVKKEYERAPSAILTFIYTYDQQGRITTSTCYDPHDPGLGIEKVETTYDTQGKPVTSLTYYTHKEGWVTQEEQEAEAKRKIPLPKGWFYAYEYDAHGNWVKRTDWECVTDKKTHKLICEKPSLVVYRTITYYPESRPSE